MTRDLIQAYKDIFKDNKVVLDTYKLANGYYYLVKENGEIEKLIVEKGEGDNPELYDYIKVRDFYSCYLDSNKSIDTKLKEKIDGKDYNMQKKITSTNIYSLFFKSRFVKGFCSDEDNGDKEALPTEFFKKGIIKYYNSLLDFNKNSKKSDIEKEYYKKEEVEKNLNLMQNAFDKVLKMFKIEKKPKDTRIRIFLDNSAEEYERVSNFYVSRKIFNSDASQVLVNKQTYGINNYNYNMNSNKPFLELKSTTYTIASLINTDDINVLRRIYVWLYNNGTQLTNIKIPQKFDFHGGENDETKITNENIYEMKVSNDNGNARIDSFEYIPNFSTEIATFEYKDLLNKKDEATYSATNIYRLEWIVNDIWITHNMESKVNYIRNSYYDYNEKVAKSKGLTNWKKDFLKNYAEVFKSLFQKEDQKIFLKNLDKIGKDIVENTLIEEYKYDKRFRNKSVQAMNLWLCLDEYFNKKEVKYMKINDIKERCKKIFTNDGKIENDDEYYFLIGQVAYFLLSKSKASKLTQDVTEPFIRASNVKVLNQEVRCLYEKYNYDVNLRDKRFNNIYSQILLCEPESSVKNNKDIILAGMLSDNMFYAKKDGGNNYEEE